MIHVENLTKYYGEFPAIKGVSFDVGEGEILGFLGPNGAGKTTTMRILTCNISPTEGTASIDGYDIKKDSVKARERIGYLPENAPLYTDMTVKDYLGFMAEIKGHRGKSKKDFVDSAIEQTGLSNVCKRIIGNLSKGYRQRVGIAQAIIGEPKTLILDEPTVGLDPKQIREIRNLIKSLGKNKTIILSTHILPEVSVICSRVAIISEGRIAAYGEPDRLVSEMGGDSEIVLCVRADLDKEKSALAQKVETAALSSGLIKSISLLSKKSDSILEFKIKCEKNKDPRGALTRRLVESGCEVVEIYMRGASLEEMFMKVISSGEQEANYAS